MYNIHNVFFFVTFNIKKKELIKKKLKSFYKRIISILKAKMEFQQINSYVFYSQMRDEMVYQFGPLVLSSWAHDNYVEIEYVDGRREHVLFPFSDHMDIDNGGGEEEKENEEEEQQEEEQQEEEQQEEEEQFEVAHPVTPQPPPNNEDDETDNEDPDDEEPNYEYLEVVVEP